MDNSSCIGLPNPNTPLALLDLSRAAYQTSVSLYVVAGSLGVLLWDILDNIGSDSELLFKNRISYTTLVYFGSRIGSLGFVTMSNILETAPTGHCNTIEKMTMGFYPFALGFSALLFFIRLSAIYNRNRLVVACFFSLWLGLLGTALIPPITISSIDTEHAQYCVLDINAAFSKSVYASIVSPLVHDTFIFIAITHRLVTNCHLYTGFKDGMVVAVSGKYLPAFSRGLLKDGQKYYLLSLISNLVAVIMVFDSSVPITMRSMCVVPNIAITNIMACRVYRNTRFGLIRETEISTTSIKGFPQRNNMPALPLFAHTISTSASRASNNVPLPNITAISSNSPLADTGLPPDERVIDIQGNHLFADNEPPVEQCKKQ